MASVFRMIGGTKERGYDTPDHPFGCIPWFTLLARAGSGLEDTAASAPFSRILLQAQSDSSFNLGF